MHPGKGRRYRSYLLRCWQEEARPGRAPVWRFALLEVGREWRRWGFGDLEALMAFLRSEVMGEGEEGPGGDSASPVEGFEP
ncbi:MAG: hypothetical protein GXP39_12340 [Chloroflexi bacterium]|nr:hypothetical protein [Chloroflexota bacterium]